MIFTYENNKVELLPEANTLPEVNLLKESDKTRGKKYFHLWLTYIYFVYREGGVYHNQFITTRKRMTCVNQLQKDADYWKEIEGNKKVMLLIEWYKKHSLNKEEQLLAALDEDIGKYLDYLKGIPYSRSIKVEKKSEDGDIQTFFRSEDNSDEKMKAIKNSKDLILYRKELKKLVRETARKRTGKKVRTRNYEE